MKLRPFRHYTSPAGAARAKALTPAPEPVTRPAPVAPPPPRVWSLLLPPGFTSDRR